MLVSLLRPLFVSKARIKILSLFFTNPNTPFFVREITRKTNEQINAVRRELESLENADIVYSYMNAGKKYFSLHKDYFFYKEVEALFLKASLPALQVAAKFEEMGEAFDLLLLTGRLVGLSDAKAPIDLFIVGDVLKAQVAEFIQEKMESDIEIRFAVVTQEEFVTRMKNKDPVLKNLFTLPENIIPINKLRKIMTESLR